ncbi:hypothetical protein [Pendulispora albinea]|uniref:DUF892 family protein n=1 Tax=Pendulispora albinea TaxID=2741071 RepID=A0ABZ2M9Z4_9BACT
MSATKTKSETIAIYAGDVHALVTHGLKHIERQLENLKSVSHEEAKPALAESKRVLEGHKSALEARIESLGGSATTPIKDAVSVITGVAEGLLDAMRSSETVKSLRDDATFFGGLGVAYLLLYTTASGLGDPETANVAQHGYEDAARLTMHLDHILPKIALEELREEKFDVADVSEKVKTMVTHAWNRGAQAASDDDGGRRVKGAGANHVQR